MNQHARRPTRAEEGVVADAREDRPCETQRDGAELDAGRAEYDDLPPRRRAQLRLRNLGREHQVGRYVKGQAGLGGEKLRGCSDERAQGLERSAVHPRVQRGDAIEADEEAVEVVVRRLVAHAAAAASAVASVTASAVASA